jgi:hypothetical protein
MIMSSPVPRGEKRSISVSNTWSPKRVHFIN